MNAPDKVIPIVESPGDEISLTLFEAPSRTALEQALAAGGLTFIRIVEAVVRHGAHPLPPSAAGIHEPA